MCEVSLYVTFFCFFFVCSHRLQVAMVDFDDLYVIVRGFAQGSAFWGLDDNPKCLGAKSPKTPFWVANRQ